jgi:asparagine synthase (glutamine-hydrolysing)
MCAINGFTHRDKPAAQKRIRAMNKVLIYRGPNAQDVYVDDRVALGHCRLSILDTSSAGTQPLWYTHEGRRLGIVFNGEIYNYVELKTELQQLGYTFHTGTDTEVILAAYLAWGKSCLEKFNGMWAFVLYDVTNQELFGSVDRFGVKPLFYCLEDKQLAFASELKALESFSQSRLDLTALELYFGLGYVPAPMTIYEGVRKLLPGTCFTYTLSSASFSTSTYYTLSSYRPVYAKKRLLEEAKELLHDAVKIRMRSDVPVGAFLSGGLDSTSVVSTMRQFTDLSKLHTFSIGFEGKYDESAAIRLAESRFGTKHHHEYFTKRTYESYKKMYASVCDEPLADLSIFPSLHVSKMAKKYVTVCLSGDGGDEVFGGYPTHQLGRGLSILDALPDVLLKLVAREKGASTSLLGKGQHVAYLLSRHPDLFLSELFSHEAIRLPSVKAYLVQAWRDSCKLGDNFSESLRVYDILHNTLGNNFLVKVDRTSMRYALEVRSPFMDWRFMELSMRIPTEYKVGFKTKEFMRELVRGIIPHELLAKKKMGFTPPVKEWMLADSAFLQKSLSALKKIHPGLAHEFSQLPKTPYAQSSWVRLYFFGLWYFQNRGLA